LQKSSDTAYRFFIVFVALIDELETDSLARHWQMAGMKNKIF
jgi:hypothetical protein|tara:strand:- start:31 stop:156 length:126 start_codon:yes stop_codon:yes gene_type:complete